jgi:hypothetical protein
LSNHHQDNQLLHQIAQGDETAFRQLFDQYRSGNVTISIGYPNLKTIMPIPLTEINANPNIEPNDGYGN